MIEEEAQKVFDLLLNKNQARAILINLLSLKRRCKDNKDLKSHLLENFYMLDKEISDYEKIYGLKDAAVFEQFKVHLEDLLKDCFIDIIPQSRKLQKLSGPCSFQYFKDPDNLGDVRILILGEIHQITRTCKKNKNVYEVQEWLWDLSHDAPECLDLFVEYWPTSTQFESKMPIFKGLEAPLEAVINQFENCKLNKCSSKLRYHHVDIREQTPILTDLALEAYEGKTITLKHSYHLLDLLYYYLGFKNSELLQEEFKHYIHEIFQIVYKKGIPLNKWNTIIEEINFVKSRITRQLRKCKLNIPRMKEVLEKINITNFLDLVNKSMDIYLLLRLFSKFDKSKLHRGPLYCKQMEYPTNVIIYCGDVHTIFYISFLKHYFKTNPKIYYTGSFDDENPNQCLTFNPPFDFFAN